MIILSHDPRFSFESRDDQPTDGVVVREIFCENVYEVLPGDVKDTGVVIDIGANIGAFSVYAAGLSDKVKVYAFEPQATNYALLETNIDRNKMAKQIQAFRMAVGDRNGSISMTDEGGGSSVSGDGDIPMIELKDIWGLVDKLEFVDVLKIDVEGYEGNIILSAPKSTLNLIRFITLEYDNRSPHTVGQLVDKLSETHQVKVVGSAKDGGTLFAHRY